MIIEEVTIEEYSAFHVNRIKKENPTLRGKSKAPTFALQYDGTWMTLVNNVGMEPQEAKNVEIKFKDLYKASIQYTQDRLKEASKTGYVTVAFGMRVRTPILKQTVLGTRSTPYEAEAEGRTAGNALFQSTGMLNNRAASEFMTRVNTSKYRYDIRLNALIHDAIYLSIRNKVGVVKWVNDNLIECMQWCDLPELYHDTVKLGAELDIYHPTWAQHITLPNYISKSEILSLCK